MSILITSVIIFPFTRICSFQFADAFHQPFDALDARNDTTPIASRFRRPAGRVHPGLRYAAGDHSEPGDRHIVADCQVPDYPDRATDHAAFTDGRTARYADTGGERGVCTNVNVVADLNLVVELDASFDHGVTD
ncbi:MAG TPA: hypothetical protein P5528_16720, partial [Steroidobacteraceae bacterium]|nr:hypothetical protein [Steroidobacteraceae bacterium]